MSWDWRTCYSGISKMSLLSQLIEIIRIVGLLEDRFASFACPFHRITCCDVIRSSSFSWWSFDFWISDKMWISSNFITIYSFMKNWIQKSNRKGWSWYVIDVENKRMRVNIRCACRSFCRSWWSGTSKVIVRRTIRYVQYSTRFSLLVMVLFFEQQNPTSNNIPLTCPIIIYYRIMIN